MSEVIDEVRSLLLTLWKAEGKPGVKAWAIHIALTYAINEDPSVNKRDIWKLIQDEYVANLHERFPDQAEPSQSYRRASGDAWEMFVEEYLNSNDRLRKEGLRAVRLHGEDFKRLTAALNVDLRPKDVDFFLQGVTESGSVRVFGALFPKASYAERIRADEGASRKLMENGLWSATVTLDAREEVGYRGSTIGQTTDNQQGCVSWMLLIQRAYVPRAERAYRAVYGARYEKPTCTRHCKSMALSRYLKIYC